MYYNLNDRYDQERFMARVTSLMKKGAFVDMTEKTQRSLPQNNYLHLLLGIVAMETGNTIEDVKVHYFKKMVNPGIFISTKTDHLGNTIEVLRSTAEVSKEEMSTAIDRFKKWGAENGMYMPNPGDEELLKLAAVNMSRCSQFL